MPETRMLPRSGAAHARPGTRAPFSFASGYMQMRCRRTPTRSPRRSPGRAPCSSPDTCCSCIWKRTGDIFRRESSRPRTPDRKRKQQSTDAGLAWKLAQNTFRRHDARSCLTVPNGVNIKLAFHSDRRVSSGQETSKAARMDEQRRSRAEVDGARTHTGPRDRAKARPH